MFEVKKDNNDIYFIKVKNDHNLEVTFSTFGASFYQILYRDKNMILCPANLDDFYKKGYHGKIVGRFSGRIDKARCTINGVEYLLDKNWKGINSLHGGKSGVSFANFKYQVIENKDYTDVIFTYLEKEDKLPGDVNYNLTYRVSNLDDSIKLIIKAKVTKETIVNITNHAFFNLNNNEDTILNENLLLNCDHYGDLDNNLICKSIKPVNKIMDFTKAHKVKDYIADPYLVNHTAFGYDHFWLKTNKENPEIAILTDELSKVKLTLSTSYPAIVVYTNNYKTDMTFLPNCLDTKHQAICLECQYVPNGINMDNVNKALLKPNEEYNEYICYSFSDL